MDWNGNLGHFVSRPADTSSSFGFLYNYNYDQYPAMEMNRNKYVNHEEKKKKKRLTNDQLESLESSFQEEIKLEPDRKMKLAKELGLQPRQIAVWFENRRVRWKAKQLEKLYDSVKQQLYVVSKEKQKLQDEVLALRAILKEQATKKQASKGYTDISGEDTIESRFVKTHSSHKPRGTTTDHDHQITQCNYVFNFDDYNPVVQQYWGFIPSYP